MDFNPEIEKKENTREKIISNNIEFMRRHMHFPPNWQIHDVDYPGWKFNVDDQGNFIEGAGAHGLVHFERIRGRRLGIIHSSSLWDERMPYQRPREDVTRIVRDTLLRFCELDADQQSFSLYVQTKLEEHI